jgi:hypothetical protein
MLQAMRHLQRQLLCRAWRHLLCQPFRQARRRAVLFAKQRTIYRAHLFAKQGAKCCAHRNKCIECAITPTSFSTLIISIERDATKASIDGDTGTKHFVNCDGQDVRNSGFVVTPIHGLSVISAISVTIAELPQVILT